MAAVQRLRQGVRALLAFTQPVDTGLAARYLSPQQLALFRRMQRGEQLHGLYVLRDALAQEACTPHDDLAVAAILHDAGKSRYRIMVWQKTIAVLVEKFAPALFRRWSREDTDSFWRRPFIVKAHHPAWGAEMLRAAGASEAAIWLVAHHQDPASQWADHPHFQLLKRLKQADSVS